MLLQLHSFVCQRVRLANWLLGSCVSLYVMLRMLLSGVQRRSRTTGCTCHSDAGHHGVYEHCTYCLHTAYQCKCSPRHATARSLFPVLVHT